MKSAADLRKVLTVVADESALASLAGTETWIFDLDNTLYPAACTLFAEVDVRIGSYIARLLGLSAEAARAVQKRYFREYGTSLRGLMMHHHVDPLDYLEYVHDIDITRVLPSPDLARALTRLPGRKLVFTNGSLAHAERVMNRLGVADQFEAVFDIVEAGYLPKPEPAVYASLIGRHGIDPRRAVMVEDIARNLVPAAALGMTTAWVRGDSHWGNEGADGDHVHHVIDDLVDWLSCIGSAVPSR